MKSLFNSPRKKTWVEKMKDYDRNHKVPNWISAIVVIATIIIVIKLLKMLVV